MTGAVSRPPLMEISGSATGTAGVIVRTASGTPTYLQKNRNKQCKIEFFLRADNFKLYRMKDDQLLMTMLSQEKRRLNKHTERVTMFGCNLFRNVYARSHNL